MNFKKKYSDYKIQKKIMQRITFWTAINNIIKAIEVVSKCEK